MHGLSSAAVGFASPPSHRVTQASVAAPNLQAAWGYHRGLRLQESAVELSAACVCGPVTSRPPAVPHACPPGCSQTTAGMRPPLCRQLGGIIGAQCAWVLHSHCQQRTFAPHPMPVHPAAHVPHPCLPTTCRAPTHTLSIPKQGQPSLGSVSKRWQAVRLVSTFARARELPPRPQSSRHQGRAGHKGSGFAHPGPHTPWASSLECFGGIASDLGLDGALAHSRDHMRARAHLQR
jgi:hypothetical protein